MTQDEAMEACRNNPNVSMEWTGSEWVLCPRNRWQTRKPAEEIGHSHLGKTDEWWKEYSERAQRM